ncbi:MAG: DUF3313 family protein [Desulfobacterium sp.]|jgi:hypothetical protein|nr:DUF3313 family protein [Desulfobacterium sp.]
MKLFVKLRLLQLLGLVAGLVVLFTECTGKNVTHSDFMGVYDHEGAIGDFTLVDRPGPGVIRIRSALTNVSFIRPEPNLLTSVFSQNQSVFIRKIPESSNLNLKKAMIEFEFLDSLTQKRLALAVEPCPRVKEAGWLRWEILNKTFDHIAENLAQKLETLKNP